MKYCLYSYEKGKEKGYFLIFNYGILENFNCDNVSSSLEIPPSYKITPLIEGTTREENIERAFLEKKGNLVKILEGLPFILFEECPPPLSIFTPEQS